MAPRRFLFACLRISVTTSLIAFVAINILMSACILIEIFGGVFNVESLQTL